MRTLFYPAVPAGTQPGATPRCAPHTDYGTLTLLFQHGVGGLEVVSAKDGTWFPATPIEGSILINEGDLLKTWSGGKYFFLPKYKFSTWNLVTYPGPSCNNTSGGKQTRNSTSIDYTFHQTWDLGHACTRSDRCGSTF